MELLTLTARAAEKETHVLRTGVLCWPLQPVPWQACAPIFAARGHERPHHMETDTAARRNDQTARSASFSGSFCTCNLRAMFSSKKFQDSPLH